MSQLRADAIVDADGTGAPEFTNGLSSQGTIKLDGNYPVGTDNVALGDTALDSLTSGNFNTVFGAKALTSNTEGSFNVGVGRLSLTSNTTGQHNAGIGADALQGNTTGSYNTALGNTALQANTTASNNTAVGYQAGYSNTTGSITALGSFAGYANTTGSSNVALGGYDGTTSSALRFNTTGSYNVGVGTGALSSNTTASQNTAVGYQAGYSNTTGQRMSAFGYNAADANTTGTDTVAFGRNALTSNTVGTGNTAFGTHALYSTTSDNYNTAIGSFSMESTTGGSNTCVGYESGHAITSGSKNTIIGRYSGNQGGLDIRTSSNNIVLSDGDGNPRGYWHGGVSSPLWIFATPTVGQNSIQFKSTTTTGNVYGPSIQFTNLSPNNTTVYALNFNDSTTNRFRVWSNGNVVNSNNSYGALSDVKLKENIVDASSQWDDIKALTVRKYSMKADNLDAPNMLGVIAQEVEVAGMGGLVFESPDTDEELNDLGTVTKQVNYSILYMKAVKALQEAMARIETLETKVANLEG